MLKRTLIYSLLFLLSLAVCLVITVPAAFVWQQVSPSLDLRPSGVRIQAVAGRLWQGQALASVHGVPTLLEWQLKGAGLMSGALPIALTVESHVGEFTADLQLGFNTQSIEIPELNLQLSGLNPALRRNRLKLDGDLLAKALRVQFEDAQPVAASGRMSWSGGDIAYPAGRELHERNLPPFNGQVNTLDDGSIVFEVRDQDASFAVLDVELTPEGVAWLQVRRRLLDLAQEPWSAQSSEQDVVFKIKKPLFTGGAQNG